MSLATRGRCRRISPYAVVVIVGIVVLLSAPAGALAGSSSAGRSPTDVSGSLSTPLTSATFDWPELHQNPDLNGFTTNTTLSSSNASNLGVTWATDLYGAALDSPVVAFDSALGATLAYAGT